MLQWHCLGAQGLIWRCDRYYVRTVKARNGDARTLKGLRASLTVQFQRFTTLRFMHAPLVATPFNPVSGEVESEDLCLPSAYKTAEMRAELGLEELAEKELNLRKGLAVDILQDLVIRVKEKKKVELLRKANAHTQATKTMAEKTLSGIRDGIQWHADRYRRNWALMRRLGLPNEDGIYRELGSKDLDASALNQEVGAGRRSNPWFFRMAYQFAAKTGVMGEGIDEAGTCP